MSTLTIEVNNDSDLQLFIALAERINVAIVEIRDVAIPQKKSAVDYLSEIASLGGVQSIQNPSEWQREIRKDKQLINRD